MVSGIYGKEDLNKETLEKRKQLLPQLKKQRVKFVKDKIVTRSQKEIKETRGKETAHSLDTSPNHPAKSAPKKINKTNMLDYVARGRSASLSLPTNTKNSQ